MGIIQVLDALDFGDGVSNDVIHLHEMLDELRVKNRIYSKWWNERVAHYTNDIEQFVPDAGDTVIYHFSGKSHILDLVQSYPCQVIIRYHNITPPEFFRESNPQGYASCIEGLDQIRSLARKDYRFWPDSSFNGDDLISYGTEPERVSVLPIFMDLERLANVETDLQMSVRMKSELPYILFVGRVAPNKCFEDLLDTFECYYRFCNRNMRLILVGNDACDSVYTEAIRAKLEGLSCRENVVFTGKVTDTQLYTYYQNAQAFLCMSEHEGFCIPLLEAMCFDLPVLAYAACAVPDIMGGSGVLLYRKDPVLAADLLHELLSDKNLREEILEKQRRHIVSFMHEAMKTRLVDLLSKGDNAYV